MLESINHNGPVVVTELGTGHNGIVWTVSPENFDKVVEMINNHGGPACWSVKAVA